MVGDLTLHLRSLSWRVAMFSGLLAGFTGCDMVPHAVDGGAPDLTGQDVRVTFLHLSLIHI